MFFLLFVFSFVFVNCQSDCSSADISQFLPSPVWCVTKNPLSKIPEPFYHIELESNSKDFEEKEYNTTELLDYVCDDDDDVHSKCRYVLDSEYLEFSEYINHVLFFTVRNELNVTDIVNFDRSSSKVVYNVSKNEEFISMDVYSVDRSSGIASVVILTNVSVHYLTYQVNMSLSTSGTPYYPEVSACEVVDVTGENVIDVRMLRSNGSHMVIHIREIDALNREYKMEFKSFDGTCASTPVTDIIEWDITGSAEGDSLNLEIHTQYMDLDHTDTSTLILFDVSGDQHELFLLFDEKKVLIVPFVKEYIHVDFDADDWQGAVWWEGENIQHANLLLDRMRRIDFRNSDCSNYIEPEHQGIGLIVLDYRYMNTTEYADYVATNEYQKILIENAFRERNFTSSFKFSSFVIKGMIEAEKMDNTLPLDVKNYFQREAFCSNMTGEDPNFSWNGTACIQNYEIHGGIEYFNDTYEHVDVSFAWPIRGNSYEESVGTPELNLNAFCNHSINFGGVNNYGIIEECMTYNAADYQCDVEKIQNLPHIRKSIFTDSGFFNIFVKKRLGTIYVVSGWFQLDEEYYYDTNYDFQMADVSIIDAPGTIDGYFLSSNGQLVMAAVSREKWELDSFHRTMEVCDAYFNDRYDLLLDYLAEQGHEDSALLSENLRNLCESDWSHEVSVDDFIYFASSCRDDMFCPSFTQPVVSAVDGGYYTAKPFTKKKCPKGYYCYQGKIELCPKGFICPDEEMQIPNICVVDEMKYKTCAEEGLTESSVCPLGSICNVPYEYVPVPGGHKQIFENVESEILSWWKLLYPDQFQIPCNGSDICINSFESCDLGEWCPIESVATETAEHFQNLTQEDRDYIRCPQGHYCDDPGLVVPIECEYSKTGDNGYSEYCPTGTYEKTLCPAGHYCHGPIEIEECEVSEYCPAGSLYATPCPSGNYCPSPEEKEVCPYMHYCPIGSIKARSCGINFFCFRGSEVNQWNFLQLAFIVLVWGAVWMFYKLFMFFRNYFAKVRSRINLKRFEKMEQKEKAASLFELTSLIKEGEMDEALSKNLEKEEGKQKEKEDSSSDDNEEEEGGEEVELKGTINSEDVDVVVPKRPKKGKKEKLCLDLAFKDLTLSLKSNGRAVVNGVTGILPHGSVTAVMGLSGCGKTSFITCLAGKAYYGNTTGTVLVNGMKLKLTQLKKLVCFVPQEDVMIRTATVEETLSFSARTRLPFTWSGTEKARLVHRCIQRLSLKEIMDSAIGDENVRGISGGQRKRVNIGMELVANPVILFLDEPTSGLDSASSLEVCDAFRGLARDEGMNIITVIHQPRYEIFSKFDNLLLLAKGGYVIYCGKVSESEEYFESLGFFCPPKVNPADFFLDCAAGRIPNKEGEYWDQWKFIDHWKKTRLPDIEKKIDNLIDATENDKNSNVKKTIKKELRRRMVNPINQFIQCFKRALLMRLRNLKGFYLDSILLIIGGVILGFLNMGLTLSVLKVHGQGAMMAMILCLCGVMGSLPTFGDNKAVFIRETASGLKKLNHFIAWNLVDMANIIINPFVFLVVVNFLATLQGRFYAYYLVCISVHWCVYGLGYNIAIIFGDKNDKIASIIIVIILNLLGGIMQPLAEMKDAWPIPFNYLPYISFPLYAIGCFFCWELLAFKDVMNIDSPIESYGYHVSWAYWAWGVVFFCGCVFRVTGYLLLCGVPPDSMYHSVSNWVMNKIQFGKNFIGGLIYKGLNVLTKPLHGSKKEIKFDEDDEEEPIKKVEYEDVDEL